MNLKGQRLDLESVLVTAISAKAYFFVNEL